MPIAPREPGVFTRRARRLALWAAAAGVIVAVARPPKPTLGPQFTADRSRVVQTADSMLRAHGGNPADWKRLTLIGTDTIAAWPRFLRQYKLIPEAQRFASTYAVPAWWVVRYVRTTGTTAQRAEEWRARLLPDGRPLQLQHFIPDSASRPSADSSAVRRIALAALSRDGIDTSTLQETELKETARPARRDVTLTYTDTTVKLPAGAAARARVQIAGDEPLVARRSVELPEAFLRADRARQTNRLMIGGAGMLLVFGLIITGGIVVHRRRPVLVQDGQLDRRGTVMVLGALIVLAVLSGLNSLPSELAGYETSRPWGSFVGTTALGLVMAIPLAMIPIALWLALNALRRRAGIPMLAGEASRAGSNDMLIAGLGLGGIIFAITRLEAVVPRVDIPRTPTTVLNALSPLLAGVTDVPASVLFAVAAIGIPVLVVAGLTPRWGLRALMAAGMLALMATVSWAMAPANEIDTVSVTLGILSSVVVVTALVVGGARSAWSWVVAALFFQALNGLREAAYGPVWQARGAGALTVLVASALIAVIAQRAAGKRGLISMS